MKLNANKEYKPRQTTSQDKFSPYRVPLQKRNASVKMIAAVKVSEAEAKRKSQQRLRSPETKILKDKQRTPIKEESLMIKKEFKWTEREEDKSVDRLENSNKYSN